MSVKIVSKGGTVTVSAAGDSVIRGNSVRVELKARGGAKVLQSKPRAKFAMPAQGPTGPTGPEGPPGSAASFSGEAFDAIAIGEAVYVRLDGRIALAQADDFPQAAYRGVAITTGVTGFAVNVRANGIVSISDWTSSTGGVSLTVASDYYLDDATPGAITTTPPARTTTGVAVLVGTAINPTDLEIDKVQTIDL